MVGIITHYFNSKNYGGLLQSYALCNIIESLGYSCEQISNDIYSENITNKKNMSTFRKIIRYGRALTRVRINAYRCISYLNKDKFIMRDNVFKEFRINIIPHSEVCVQSKLGSIVHNYNIIITGSDQVWNPIYIDIFRSFFLDFVPDDIRKFSYAASVSVNSLTEYEANTMIPLIKRMESISVREKSAKTILEKYIKEKPISVELDPTLLLDECDWNKINNDKDYKNKGKYIFCYFLGDNKLHRKATKRISKRTGLKVITLPYMLGRFRICDAFFGDEKLYDVGPSEFIGLIKNAEYVFTDSFHAVVFSSIYHKKFFVFKRDSDTDKNSMNSRITDILDDFGIPERLISDDGSISDELLYSNIDYCKKDKFINKRREESINYLKKALSGEKQ